ncbi:MAG: preprotein translocase subunit SecG [Fimbriimonas sp.]|nr:preprotein translocase subunit SecG [Fimbriimonas sp.]
MQVAYNILLFLALMVAIVFGLLVLVTGKGDAMSGGGSIRTTFKGKASFDDFMSRLTLILGTAFFVLMLLIDGVSNRMNYIASTTAKTAVQQTNTKPK